MIISKVSRGSLEKALREINKKYDNNIMWNNIECLSDTRFRVTLRVVSSKEKGHRLSASQGRRLINACWHVHGDFFDALPHTAKIYSRGKLTYINGEWEDFNIGSQMAHIYASDACECENDKQWFKDNLSITTQMGW